MSTETIIDCPALHWKARTYPAERFGWRVPKTVLMLVTVRPDEFLRAFTEENRTIVAEMGRVYPVWTNSFGAVAAVFDDGRRLGLKPAEFQVVDWH